MATELRDGVWQIPCRGVNCYLLEEEDGLVLVDAGTPLDARLIRSAVGTAGYELGDVTRVLLTHMDVDHVGALPRLVPDLDAPLYIGPADARIWLREATPPRGVKGLLLRLFRRIARPPDLPITRITDGSRVGDCRVLATPGHTPGHTVYVSPERDVAFLGDMVIERGGDLRAAPWYLNHDTAGVHDSVREFASRTPHFEAAAMGHGDPLASGGEVAMERLATSLVDG